MLVTRAIVVLLLLYSGVLFAAPLCTTGTLASYEALGSGGCISGQLLVKDFVFSVLAAGGGADPIPDTAITVTPTSSAPGTFGLNFASAGFTVTGARFIKYLIAYTWDSHDIRSMDDLLDIAVTPPALVKITTDGCVGAAFIGTSCPAFIDTVTVSDDGITPVLFDKVTFPPMPVPVLGIRNTIDLEGNGASATFDSFTNEVTTPEPATWVIMCACLACCGKILKTRNIRSICRRA